MDYNVSELAVPNSQSSQSNMIPIFIGTSKTLHSQIPSFSDNSYETIQLALDSGYIVDPTSIQPNITYWQEVSSQFMITNSAATNSIAVSIPITQKFNTNTLFVVYDVSNNLLFASTINNFKYNLNNLISITLDNTLALTGSLRCKLLLKTTALIPYTYNPLNYEINLTFANKTNISSFPSVIVNESTISFNYINNSVILNQYPSDSVTMAQAVANEQNLELSKGLYSSSTAIVISIPDDTHINEAIELMEQLTSGYYIVPISLSSNSINTLASFVKTVQNKYVSLLVPSVDISKVIFTGTYTQ